MWLPCSSPSSVSRGPKPGTERGRAPRGDDAASGERGGRTWPPPRKAPGPAREWRRLGVHDRGETGEPTRPARCARTGFKGGPSGRGRKGRGSRSWTSEERARRSAGNGSSYLSAVRPGAAGPEVFAMRALNAGPTAAIRLSQPGGHPWGTLTGFVLPEPGKLFRALPVLSPVLVRLRSPPGNSYRFSEPKPPALAPLHPHPGVCKCRRSLFILPQKWKPEQLITTFLLQPLSQEHERLSLLSPLCV